MSPWTGTIFIVADVMASMQNYLTLLNTSLPQIISISALTRCFSRVGVVAYRDYTDFEQNIQFSGWLDLAHAEDPVEHSDIVAFAESLKPKGGGDYPEATKTGLAKAYAKMRPDAKTIILLYTDAPPYEVIPTPKSLTNADAEIKALSDPQSYNSFGPSFLDWVSAAKMMGHGEKQAQVFTLLEWDILPGSAAYYIFLCTMTDGACIWLDDSEPDTISKASVELLLARMRVEKLNAAITGLGVTATWSYYASKDRTMDLQNEGERKRNDSSLSRITGEPAC